MVGFRICLISLMAAGSGWAQGIVLSSVKPVDRLAVDNLSVAGANLSTPLRRINDTGDARVVGQTFKPSTGFPLDAVTVIAESTRTFGQGAGIRLAILKDTNGNDRGEQVVYNQAFNLGGLTVSASDFITFELGANVPIEADVTYEFHLAFDPASAVEAANFPIKRSENSANPYQAGVFLDDNNFHFGNRGFPVTNESLAVSTNDRDLWFGLRQASPPPPDRAAPNIVLIFTDDMGYRDLGVQGSPDVKTPNIDALAVQGARFTNAYVTHSFCAPSRAALLSGIHQMRLGFRYNPATDPDNSHCGLPFTTRIMPQVLKTAGYATGMVGKWHLGDSPENYPVTRGFDRFFGMTAGSFNYFNPTMRNNDEGSLPNPKYIYDQFGYVGNIDYMTDDFTGQAVRFIRDSASGRFFLYLAYNAPHGPFESLASDQDPSIPTANNRRNIVAMIKALDRGVGTVRQVLAEQGLTDNTLIVFTNDNGGQGSGADNTPLRDFKGSWYEGGIRVPFMMAWPGTIAPGQVIHHPVSTLDLYPTFQEVAKVDAAEKPPGLEGINLMPLVALVGVPGPAVANPPERSLFWGVVNTGAIRKGDWKLKLNGASPAQLFNLAADISETTDLAATETAKRDELLADWQAWNALNVPARFPRAMLGSNPLTAQISSHPDPFLMLTEAPTEITVSGSASHSAAASFTTEWEVFEITDLNRADRSTVNTANAEVADRLANTTSVRFIQPGEYIVRFNAFDGQFHRRADLYVNVKANAVLNSTVRSGDLVWFRPTQTTGYVAPQAAGSSVAANAAGLDGLSTWEIVETSSAGVVGLRSTSTGGWLETVSNFIDSDHLVTAAGSGAEPPSAARFILVDGNDGKFQIKPAATPRLFLRANADSATRLIDYTGAPGVFECDYEMGFIPQGTIATYVDWSAGTGLSASPENLPSDDANGDNRINVYHFAFDENPLALALSRDKSLALTSEQNGKRRLTLTIPVLNDTLFWGNSPKVGNHLDCTYRIRGSTDLQIDNPLDVRELTPPVTAGLPVLNNGWEYRTFMVEGAADTLVRAFMWVEVVFP